MQDTALQSSVTQALGIWGWARLDPVLMAALANESPLLLVGTHGAAKSLLVERLAMALHMSWRHYNAALINYDDLVGIPMPDESGTRLQFATTPGTVWDTGFLFFDEISRCRPDLANKLYPLIHERRVLGIDLEGLQHRWAAMNPPAPDDPDPNAPNSAYYIGSEALDPALIDRFPFVIRVPHWGELSREDRLALVAYQNGSTDTHSLDLRALVSACQVRIADVEAEFADWLSDYIVTLVDLLEQTGLPQSPRRARMMARSVAAVHAARMVLEGVAIDDEEAVNASAELALVYGLPQTATEVPPNEMKLVALHRQAWDLVHAMNDPNWREVMAEFDPLRRVAMADGLGFSDADLSKLITQALSAEESDPRQVGMATAMFLAFRDRRDLDPSAFEPLAQLAYHVLEPRLGSFNVGPNSKETQLWDEIREWIESSREDSAQFRLARNFLLYGFPNAWRSTSWQDALETFGSDLLLFNVTLDASDHNTEDGNNDSTK